jgi:hypothetical protein
MSFDFGWVAFTLLSLFIIASLLFLNGCSPRPPETPPAPPSLPVCDSGWGVSGGLHCYDEASEDERVID